MPEDQTQIDKFTSAIVKALNTEGRLSKLEEKADTREKGEKELKEAMGDGFDLVHTRVNKGNEKMDRLFWVLMVLVFESLVFLAHEFLKAN